jgi:predicted transcriptional regulator
MGRREIMAHYVMEDTASNLPLRQRYDLWGLPLGKKYRSHFEIIALMLEAVKDGSEGRFSIMKQANVNCSQLDKFLDSLIRMGFIEIDVKRGRVMCRATDKGLAFLKQYNVLLGMLSTTQTENNPHSIILETRVRHS